MNKPISRGDIYYVDFGNVPGSLMQGIRPAMVLQNNVGNRHAPTVIVAAITTEIKKLRQPTHIFIGARYGLPEISMLMLEQIITVDKRYLLNYIGTADKGFMRAVDHAANVSIGTPRRRPRRRKSRRDTSA